MDLLNAKNNYSPVVKESCLIWRNHSLQWLDRLGQMDKGRIPPPLSFQSKAFQQRQLWNITFLCQIKITFRLSCIQEKILSNLGMVFTSRHIIYIVYLNSDLMFTVILFTYAKKKGTLWLDAMRVPVCWSLWSSSRCFVEASHSLKPPFHASVLFRMVSERLEQLSGEEGFILIQMTGLNLPQ